MSSGTSTRYNFLIIFFVALGSFTYGFNSAISGSVLGLKSFLDYFNLSTSGPDAARSNRIIGGMLCSNLFDEDGHTLGYRDVKRN